LLSFEIENAEKMVQLGESLGRLLREGSIVCLIGELGAGKTTLARGIARGLGIKDYVTSPTFTIIKEYGGTISLYHIDVYRLEDPEEVLYLGLEEYLFGSGVAVIEWADRIQDYLPDSYLEVRVRREKGEKRRVLVSAKGKGYEDIIGELDKTCVF